MCKIGKYYYDAYGFHTKTEVLNKYYGSDVVENIKPNEMNYTQTND